MGKRSKPDSDGNDGEEEEVMMEDKMEEEVNASGDGKTEAMETCLEERKDEEKSEEVDSDELMNDSDTTGSPSMDSPPGMEMRSGRKKRRRSLETTGLTPTNAKDKKPRSTSSRKKPKKLTDGKKQGHSDHESDAKELSEKEYKLEKSHVAARPLPAAEVVVSASVADTVTTAATAFSAAKPEVHLRMPSAQTPGKTVAPKPLDTPYDNRHQGRVALEEIITHQPTSATTIDAVHLRETDDVDLFTEPLSPSRRLFHSFKTILQDMIVPPGAQGLDFEEDEISEQSSVVNRPYFWFIVLLLVQAYFFPYWINPVMDSVMIMTDKSVLLYKDLLGVPPTVIENVTTVTVTPPKKRKMVVQKSTNDEVTRHVKELTEAKVSLKDATDVVVESTKGMASELDSLKTTLDQKKKSLDAWDAALTVAEAELANDVPSPETLEKLKQASLMDVNVDVLTAEDTDVPVWEVITKTGCPQPPPIEGGALVTPEDVNDASAALQDDMLKTIYETTENPVIVESIKEWVEERVEVYKAEAEGEDLHDSRDGFDVDYDGDHDDGPSIGLSEEETKKIIHQRIEGEYLEALGIMDVASLYNGAEVIKRGPRATSPSLINTLPLVNRLMSATKLRFYGHGPDAALSPVVGENGLGQCWSFESVAKNKNPRWRNASAKDSANGQYATLSVRLAKASRIKRVVLEHIHAPNKPLSAIMDFRIIAFKDKNADGTGITLGEYQFKTSSESQEFEVMVDNDEIQSVTLAIDSTYNQDYACLYRFRVMEE